MMHTEAEARTYVEGLGDGAALDRLDRLKAALIEENQHQNLVSRNSLDHIWLRHFADSAQLLEHVPRETLGPWLDLGSGAGFPGLVIAALCPQLSVILVESRKRRVEWLARMCAELGLSNCRVEGVRLELVNSFDAGVISARAFARLPKLIALSARFSTADTYWVLPKGRSATQEVAELPKSLRRMFHVDQSRSDAEAGIILGRGRAETSK